MYHLFYAGHLLFGNIGYLLGAVGAVNAIVKREKLHAAQINDVYSASYWEGVSEAWPEAHREGEGNMLEVCQALARESIELSGADPETVQYFNQIVNEWPQFALSQVPQEDPEPEFYTAEMFLE